MPLDVLKEIYQELYATLSVECIIYFETFTVSSIEPIESFSVTNDQKISFDKNSPTNYEGTITYVFKLLEDFVLRVPLEAIVCGFEKIVPQSGVSVIEYELNKEDQSQSYFPEFKFNQLLETSKRECYINETTFELVQSSDFAPLTLLKGKDYVMIDQSQL